MEPLPPPPPLMLLTPPLMLLPTLLMPPPPLLLRGPAGRAPPSVSAWLHLQRRLLHAW
jgi:hypothetical protein